MLRKKLTYVIFLYQQSEMAFQQVRQIDSSWWPVGQSVSLTTYMKQQHSGDQICTKAVICIPRDCRRHKFHWAKWPKTICYETWKQDGNYVKTEHWGAFVQPMLPWKSSMTYWQCMSVSFGIQRAMRMPRIVICGLSGSTIFFHICS